MIRRIHSASWLAATMLTGIVTGFYLGHALVLGRFFSWLAEPGQETLLRRTYSEFRLTHSPRPYLAVIGLEIAAVAIFAGFSLWLRRGMPRALAAAACVLAVPAFHLGSGFHRLERGVLSGTIGGSLDLARFAAWNVPVHACYSAATLAAFLLLCAHRDDRAPADAGA